MASFNVNLAHTWKVGGVEPQATVLGCAWSVKNCTVMSGGDASVDGVVPGVVEPAREAEAAGDAAVVGVGWLHDAESAQVGVACGVTPAAAANVALPVGGALFDPAAADEDAEAEPEPTLDARCGGFEPK